MILLDKSISGTCNSCGSDKNVFRIHIGKYFDSANPIYFCEKCRKELIKKLSATVVLGEEPLEEHGGKWFPIWKQDKENILATMHRNLAADLDAGYSYTGQSVQKQLMLWLEPIPVVNISTRRN